MDIHPFPMTHRGNFHHRGIVIQRLACHATIIQNGHVIMDIECTHGMLEITTGLAVIQSEKELLVIYIP